ncbi:uncharacterized protein BDV14DRAFT_202560 [Aspergillus stella-maris]|uniref:uncharacterized protein n=1 Tax=Aspergillus stella-maris TaxID=1810926 RepID=UPI003CCCDDBB
MATRLAACEPCRKSKLACDHSQPVCARCTNSNRVDACVYRTAPFKRRKTDAVAAEHFSDKYYHYNPLHSFTRWILTSIVASIDAAAAILASSPIPTPTPNRYPNPGFIGSSSHVAIFNHILVSGLDTPSTICSDETPASRTQPEDMLLVQRAADALKQLLSTGANLSLTGGILQHCIAQGTNINDTTITLPIPPASSPTDWHILNTKYLLANSSMPLQATHHPSTFAGFCAPFSGSNFRWETMGILLSAVTRAALDTPVAPPLYMNQERRYALRTLCTRVADYALEVALSLDCLNDLQLFLQYENWIVQTHVYGDHSYHSWRKLGDVIASIYALGYHENLDQQRQGQQQFPAPFLTELRKAVFARVYSGDKNVAIFVGRPPRMNKGFCHFQIPSCSLAGDVWLTSAGSGPGGLNHGGDANDDDSDHDGDHHSGSGDDSLSHIAQWDPDTQASYIAESRWTALCASLKEEILCLQRQRGRRESAPDKAFQGKVATIKASAEKQFTLLPAHFQLHGPLRKYTTTDPFKRDFVAAVRLNHLHVLFLLSLLQLRTPAEPDGTIIAVAEEMISIVVDLILLRDQIVNSGTSLVWKIAYYALPAAGILLLAMLRRWSVCTAAQQQQHPISRPHAIHHLTILAAELEAGSIIQPREPNYNLLCKAMHTIQSFLDFVATDAVQGVPIAAEELQLESVTTVETNSGNQDTSMVGAADDHWAGLGFGGLNA